MKNLKKCLDILKVWLLSFTVEVGHDVRGKYINRNKNYSGAEADADWADIIPAAMVDMHKPKKGVEAYSDPEELFNPIAIRLGFPLVW